MTLRHTWMQLRQWSRSSDPHPPGVKALSQLVEKFSGRSGGNHFDVWLLNFIEATGNCRLSDEQSPR